MSEAPPVFILERSRVARLLDLDDCIRVVEQAFRLRGEGRAAAPAALGLHADGGGFHVKAALLDLGRPCFVAKANANFPGNRSIGLPTIQGVILLSDSRDGRPLAIMDSMEITLLRTAAATAVAAKHLARDDAKVVTVCGCGAQAGPQLQALRRVLPVERVFAYDRDGCRADILADHLSTESDLDARVAGSLREALRQSDVCVTCTTSSEFLLGRDDVRPGAFVAAVGVDNPEKREIHPDLMAAATVVVDDLEQCAAIGDLHHALEAGAMTRSQVHADLAAVVAGRARGRVSRDEITLFDSTGIALEDAAAAALVFERALLEGGCRSVQLAG
jgi:ornithine cyclodeaminase/alanine dehydrogenase-like protein (mu-crystallin family)